MVKIIYFADKYHLNKYYRLILGDRYIKTNYGHVGSAVKDILDNNVFLEIEIINISKDSFSRNNNYIIPKRVADMSYLSASNIECLESSAKKYKDKSLNDLAELTHIERGWRETAINS